MIVQHLKPNEILVDPRVREDYGDIDDLAESIKKYGLIQPIVISGRLALIAGGRRLEACKKLGLEEIPCVVESYLSKEEHSIMELEENIRRKDLTWQENCTAVAKIHLTYFQKEAISGGNWTADMTAAVLGISPANVSYCRSLASKIKVEGNPYSACVGMTDAIKLMAKEREDVLLAELAKRVIEIPKTGEVFKPTDEDVGIETEQVTTPPPSGQTFSVPISEMCFLGGAMELLTSWPKEFVDHIITDPPYGVDIEMMDQSGPEGGWDDSLRISETHQREHVWQLYGVMFEQFFNVLKPNGFCALWCDIMDWGDLYKLAISSGFRVQRWPIVWVKTHVCRNMAARYNFTKTTELVMVCRKPSTTLHTPVGQSHIVAGRDDIKDLNHPFAKPYSVWEFLIKSLTLQGQLILDPFAGVGSCPLAAMRLARRFKAIEVDEKHYNVMIDEVQRFLVDRLRNVEFV